VGLIVGHYWAAWHLQDGWKSDQRDIGWAESVALELAVFGLYMPVFTMPPSLLGVTTLA